MMAPPALWPIAPEDTAEIVLRHNAKVNRALFSPDGILVATASNDGTARLWNASTGLPLGLPLAHGEAVWQSEFNPAGDRLATASLDGRVKVWDVATGRQVGIDLRAWRCGDGDPLLAGWRAHRGDHNGG